MNPGEASNIDFLNKDRPEDVVFSDIMPYVAKYFEGRTDHTIHHVWGSPSRNEEFVNRLGDYFEYTGLTKNDPAVFISGLTDSGDIDEFAVSYDKGSDKHVIGNADPKYFMMVHNKAFLAFCAAQAQTKHSPKTTHYFSSENINTIAKEIRESHQGQETVVLKPVYALMGRGVAVLPLDEFLEKSLDFVFNGNDFPERKDQCGISDKVRNFWKNSPSQVFQVQDHKADIRTLYAGKDWSATRRDVWCLIITEEGEIDLSWHGGFYKLPNRSVTDVFKTNNTVSQSGNRSLSEKFSRMARAIFPDFVSDRILSLPPKALPLSDVSPENDLVKLKLEQDLKKIIAWAEKRTGADILNLMQQQTDPVIKRLSTRSDVRNILGPNDDQKQPQQDAEHLAL